MPERIEQRYINDCQTAVCAMLADDWTYDSLKAEYGTPMSMGQIVEALHDDGLYYNLLRADSTYQIADFAHYHDRLYVVIESPISERDPELYHHLAAGDDDQDVYDPSFRIGHAIAIRDGEVLDPKPDPYFTCWHDLKETPYPVRSVSLFSTKEPRTLDFTNPAHRHHDPRPDGVTDTDTDTE